MNYENQTKRQLIEECKRLKRMINKKENNYVLLEKDLDCLQQSIANYVEIVLHQRKKLNELQERFRTKCRKCTNWDSKISHRIARAKKKDTEERGK